jgi:hypothetical protein
MPPDEISLLRLLQLADSALPVGGSAHSYGLETLAQEGSLESENLEDFLCGYLEETAALDAAFVRRAWRGAGFSLGLLSGQGLQPRRSQAKACATILPNPTARNVNSRAGGTPATMEL